MPVELTVNVTEASAPVDPNAANGSVDPNSGTYRQYEVVHLTAHPKHTFWPTFLIHPIVDIGLNLKLFW